MNNVYNPQSSSGSINPPPSIQNNEVEVDKMPRVLPRQVSTGLMKGTQSVGGGGTLIDSANNRITIGAPDGSTIGMGAIPDTLPEEYGFFSLDSNGKLIMKIVNGTKYVYNPSDDYLNVTQDGLLPDGSGGFVVAKEGYNVSDAF